MGAVPPWPRWLGLAGILPQLAALLALWSGRGEWRFAALSLAWGYAALIFSFLGGLWWGLAARKGEGVPGWVWGAAVGPSLVAFVTYLPWVFAAAWPQPSLMLLGVCILASPLVDRALGDLAPSWWMALRWPLSLGLGLATLLSGFA